MQRTPPDPAGASPPGLVQRVLPWWAEVDASSLRADAAAAVLAALLVLPQALALAQLAGLPPAWGLYAATVGMAVAAVAGSSRFVLTGPTNALALALAASVAPLALAGGGGIDAAEYQRLALVLTLMVGGIQLAVGLLRLGGLAHFISPAVLLGFTAGAALLIAWHAARALAPAPGAGLAGVAAAAVAALTVACALALPRLVGAGPAMSLALVAGSFAAWSLQPLAGIGLEHVGNLPSPWPPLGWPQLQWQDLQRLGAEALALTLVALGQSVAIAKTLSARDGLPLDVNRECAGQGLANIAVSMSSGFAVCGSLNRSLPYRQAGARTPLGALMAALLLLAGVALAAPLLAWVSVAAIQGLLLLVAWSLFDRAGWRELWRLDRREWGVAAGTALAMLLLPLHVAVLAGVAASLLLYLHRTAHPALRRMGFASPPAVLRGAAGAEAAAAGRPFVVIEAGAPQCPQLLLLRMEGPVWFGAEAHVADALRALRHAPGAGAGPAPKHLLVMSKSMNFIDAAGVALWEQERRERSALGGSLHFHRPRPQVLQAWERAGFLARLGPGRVHADKRSAIAAIVPRLDPAVCARCRARVFEECASQPGGPAGASGSSQPSAAS